MKSSKQNAFTLIELLVVISIIAILAGIALPVFGEVQVRGAQTKALSNAKQIGLACKLFASDYSGNYPLYTGELSSPTKTPATPGSTSNSVLQTLMPDYLPDRSIFVIPKSAYCNKAGLGSSATPYVLGAGQNEWAYVLGLTDTSNSRFPLLADGFAKGTSYSEDESAPGGVWKAKKAIVIRCDISGNVETLNRQTKTVKRSEEDNKDAFQKDPGATPPWLGEGTSVLQAVSGN